MVCELGPFSHPLHLTWLYPFWANADGASQIRFVCKGPIVLQNSIFIVVYCALLGE